jgi:hypothetical protein
VCLTACLCCPHSAIKTFASLQTSPFQAQIHSSPQDPRPPLLQADTYGSVDPDTSTGGCGLAVYQGRTLLGTHNFSIPNGSSTLQAELYEIYKAMVSAEPLKPPSILVATDSLVSIQHEHIDKHLLLSLIHVLLKARSYADRETYLY